MKSNTETIASTYFGNGAHTSFVLENVNGTPDAFKDQFGGSWDASQISIFTAAALNAGVSVKKPQSYKAAGKTLGSSYTIEYRYSTGKGLEVRRSGG